MSASGSKLCPSFARAMILVVLGLVSAWFAASRTEAATFRLMPALFDAHLLSASAPGSVRAGRGSVQVAVHTQVRVSTLTVRVNGGRPDIARIVRLSRLRWLMILPDRLFHGGVNQVKVDARSGRRRGSAFVHFEYLLPRRGLVTVRAPAEGVRVHSVISQTLSVARGASIQAWLNGRSEAVELRWYNQRLSHGRVIVRFDAGSALGVHFGINRLVVQAQTRRFYTRIVRRVTVTRAGPIIDAGTSQTIVLGQSARLGATHVSAVRGGPAGFHWRLYSAPSGALSAVRTGRPLFSSQNAAQVLFTPNRPGVYRLGLEVDAAGANVRGDAKQQVTVSVPGPPLVQLQTEVTEGGQVGIRVGDAFVAGPPMPVQVFVLDRHTLAMPPAVKGFADMRKIGPWITQQQQTLVTPIVILQTTTQGFVAGGDPSDFNAALAQIGASSVWRDCDCSQEPPIPAPFVAIGVAGLAPGTATQSCAPGRVPAASPSRCAIDGWFSSPTGAGSYYTFAQGDYVPFEISPTLQGAGLSNTMTVGAQQIAAPPFPTGSLGGYHVAVLDRYTLRVLSNNSFATGDPGSGPTAQQAMLDTLTAAVHDDSQMVLVTSVGEPVSASSRDAGRWTAIMNAISALGGTPDVFARAHDNQRYTLVGIAGDVDYGHVAEASSVAQIAGEPAPSGIVSGLLERSRHNLFEPLLASPAAPQNALYTAIYRPPTPWPDSAAPDYANASLYLAQQLLPGEEYLNVRAAYSSTTATASWESLVSRLKSIPYPGSGYKPAFSRATFDALVNDYAGTTGTNATAGEFEMVDGVNKFLKDTLKEPFSDSQLADYISIQTLADDIENAVLPPGTGKSTSDILAIMQGFADVAGVFAGPLDGVASFVSAVFGIAAAATSDPETGAPTESRVQSTADDLATDLVQRENDILQTFDTLDGIAVSDFGRLSAMNNIIVNLHWGVTVSDQLTQYLQASERQQIATALTTAYWTLPPSDVLYHPPTWFTVPGDTTQTEHPVLLTDVRDWECNQDFDTIHPYNQMAPSTEYASIVGWFSASAPSQTVFFVVAAHQAGNFSGSLGARQCSRHWPPYDLASGPVFSALFAPIGATVTGTKITGIGLYPASWWWRNFTNATCWGPPYFGQTDCFGSWPPGSPNSYSPAPVWAH